MNWDKYECDGQMSIFDLAESEQPLRTLNDYWHAEALGKPIRLTSKELKAEQDRLGENVGWYFAADVPKCCDCFPMLKHTGGIDEKDYLECIVCGRRTEPVHDYSWRESRRLWTEMFKPICKHSNHSCNKENLWEVAEMDGGTCQRVCCRQCDITGCGARCNGSEEPKKVEQEKSTDVTKKSCGNCLRFNTDIEQPPDGWGHIGYCVEHHEKCNDISYCQSWEPKPVEVIQYTAKEYAQAIVKHLIDHCRSWGMNEKLNQLKEDKTTEIFHKLFCKITRTYYVIMDEWHFNVEFCKDNTVNIKRCGRDYNERPMDATIQLQDVLDEL